jgi:CheY-like chemotaxis protein
MANNNPIIAAAERRAGLPEKTLPIDFGRFLYLVVDAIPEMRSSMSMVLSSLGANRVEFAGRTIEAIGRVQRTQYDVILADYTLQHEYDGVHLYEELKQRNLIKQSCVFFIVTAERRSQKVIGAVEMAPDDYLLKPFTGQMLAERLEKAIRKKKEFECVDDAILNHEYLKAIDECNRRISKGDPYILDFLKLKGRLSIQTGDYLTARQTYEQILRSKPVPWAKLGLAKSLYHLKEFAASEGLFREVLQYNDRVMEAYDWLSKIQAQRGELGDAQATLQQAVKISPWIVPRQRKLGEVAHRNHEHDIAEDALKKTISIAKYSFWRDAGDYGSLARVQIDKGDTKAAQGTVQEIRRDFDNQPAAEMLSYAIESIVHKKSGQNDMATAALAEAQKRMDAMGKDVPEKFALDVAQACFVNGDPHKGTEIVKQVVKNNHENSDILARVNALYHDVGRAEEGSELIRETANDIVDLNNRAVRLAREGDIEGSIEMFLRAAEEMPNNQQILLNTVNALLAFVNTKGWHESYMQQALRHLEKARSLNQVSSKFQKIDQLMKATKARYGVN